MVAALYRGQRVAVECPAWCVVDHAAENVISLDDFSHEGAPISLPVPVSGAAERVLIARLVQWPFASDEAGRAAYLSLEGTDDGEVASLPASAAPRSPTSWWRMRSGSAARSPSCMGPAHEGRDRLVRLRPFPRSRGTPGAGSSPAFP
ncbi:DUF6907 domain-containing protein [Streptomyces coffeae]|uniref:DUF6907 domain-containing protein n=1 Tax=Streptomyces coffeae TaxID=621382 RepID=UPI0035569C23